MPQAQDSPIRVLLADDDPDYLEVMAELLELTGLTVFTARTAAETRAVLGAEDPDILLVDRLLGDADGAALAREIAASASLRPRVALISGLSTSPDEQAGFASDGIAVFPKPIDVERLRAFCHGRQVTSI